MKGVHVMKGRFVGGITAGLLLGAAAGMMMMPRMNYRTRRMVNKASKRFTDRAENIIDNVMNYTR